MFYNFLSNFKFAPTYAELEAKLELYAGLLLDQDDLLDAAYEEQIDLMEENENLVDILDTYLDEYEAKLVQVSLMKNYIAKLEKELREANAKLGFIKGVVCN